MTSARHDGGTQVLLQIEELFEEMLSQQRAKVLGLARRIDPAINAEDLLSPVDFPAIAEDPRFNFEDGLLAGIASTWTAVRARIVVPRLQQERA